MKVILFVIFGLTIQTNARLLMEHLLWSHHYSRVSKFHCNTPQERVIPLKELMDNDVLSSYQKIIPPVTVLHRCDDAGCCPIGQACTPLTMEDVGLVFGAFEKDGRMMYLGVQAVNHTSCGCRELPVA